MISNKFTTYVGVDISWSVDPRPESTGLCTIRGDELVDCSLATTDSEIVDYVIDHNADFVGIDAPLIVRNNDSQRPVESELRESGHSVLPANRDWFRRSFGGVRGERLVESLKKNGYQLSKDTTDKQTVIEVYPRPTIEAILGHVPPYKDARKDEIFEGLRVLWEETRTKIGGVDFQRFEDLVPDDIDEVRKSDLKRVGDQIDAFYSGYVLKIDDEEQGRTKVFGDLRRGSILTAI